MRDGIELLHRRPMQPPDRAEAAAAVLAARPSSGLRLEDAAGREFDPAAALNAHWQRPPYAMTIRLVHRQHDQDGPGVIDEAVIGTRGSRAAVRDRIEATMARMWRDAERGLGRGAGCAAPPQVLKPGLLGSVRARLARGVERLGERVLVEWWSVGRAPADLGALVAGRGLGAVDWVEPRSGAAYLADPFVWPGSGRLLAEEMPTAGGRGRIVALEQGGDGKLGPATVVLEDDAHHSYPCAFADHGAVYLLPETPEPGRTTLYRLNDDATLAPVCHVAPERRLADPTLFRAGGRYWIACTDIEIGAHDNLCLLHADRLEGPWRSHRLDPVRIDVRGARPGGPVFALGGALFRPGQDCARGYGAALVLHRIETLTPDAFREIPVATLHPDRRGPFPQGLHTLSAGEGCVWVDGKRLVFNPGIVAGKLRAKLVSRLAGKGRGR